MKYLIEFASTHDYEVGDCRDGIVEVIIETKGAGPYTNETLIRIAVDKLQGKVDDPNDWHWVGTHTLNL